MTNRRSGNDVPGGLGAHRGGLKIDGGLRFNSDPDGSNGGRNNEAGSLPNHVDAASVGLGYDFPFYSTYLGASYLRQNDADNYERNFFGVVGKVKTAVNTFSIGIRFDFEVPIL